MDFDINKRQRFHSKLFHVRLAVGNLVLLAFQLQRMEILRIRDGWT